MLGQIGLDQLLKEVFDGVNKKHKEFLYKNHPVTKTKVVQAYRIIIDQYLLGNNDNAPKGHSALEIKEGHKPAVAADTAQVKMPKEMDDFYASVKKEIQRIASADKTSLLGDAAIKDLEAVLKSPEAVESKVLENEQTHLADLPEMLRYFQTWTKRGIFFTNPDIKDAAVYCLNRWFLGKAITRDTLKAIDKVRNELSGRVLHDFIGSAQEYIREINKAYAEHDNSIKNQMGGITKNIQEILLKEIRNNKGCENFFNEVAGLPEQIKKKKAELDNKNAEINKKDDAFKKISEELLQDAKRKISTINIEKYHDRANLISFYDSEIVCGGCHYSMPIGNMRQKYNLQKAVYDNLIFITPPLYEEYCRRVKENPCVLESTEKRWCHVFEFINKTAQLKDDNGRVVELPATVHVFREIDTPAETLVGKGYDSLLEYTKQKVNPIKYEVVQTLSTQIKDLSEQANKITSEIQELEEKLKNLKGRVDEKQKKAIEVYLHHKATGQLPQNFNMSVQEFCELISINIADFPAFISEKINFADNSQLHTDKVLLTCAEVRADIAEIVNASLVAPSSNKAEIPSAPLADNIEDPIAYNAACAGCGAPSSVGDTAEKAVPPASTVKQLQPPKAHSNLPPPQSQEEVQQLSAELEEQKAATKALNAKLEAVSSELEAFKSKNAELASANEELTERNQALAFTNDATLAAREEALRANIREMEAREKLMSEREAHMATKEEVLRAKARELEVKTSELAAQQALIEVQKAHVATMQANIESTRQMTQLLLLQMAKSLGVGGNAASTTESAPSAAVPRSNLAQAFSGLSGAIGVPEAGVSTALEVEEPS